MLKLQVVNSEFYIVFKDPIFFDLTRYIHLLFDIME